MNINSCEWIIFMSEKDIIAISNYTRSLNDDVLVVVMLIN